MLEVNVSAKKGKFQIRADFEALEGVVAMIGSSGAGKSSLLRLIAGLDHPIEGRIALGSNVWFDSELGLNLPPHKRKIGMVFQSGLLLEHKSVLQNIVLGARRVEVSNKLVELTGCADLLGRPVAGLSGGEQQRVMLARALAGKPELLLLDEPLSALDPNSREQILELMGALFPTLKIPIIYVTHAFEEAVRLAKSFIRLEGGAIIANGGARDVLSQGSVVAQELAVSSIVEGEVSLLDGGEIARVKLGEQFIEVPGGDLVQGQQVALRLWARDLILASKKPEGLSARNALGGKIMNLVDVSHGQVLVEVLVEGICIYALILCRTAKDMGLKPDQPIYLIFKSASVESVLPNTLL